MGNQGLSVEIAAAEQTAVQDWYTEEGVLSFGDTSQVISQVSGAVKEIPVHENDRVEKGDILMVIDSTDYEYAASLAQDTLDGLTAKLDQSRIGQVMTVSPQEYLSSAKKETEAAEAPCSRPGQYMRRQKLSTRPEISPGRSMSRTRRRTSRRSLPGNRRRAGMRRAGVF